MKVSIQVKLKAKEERVEQIDATHFIIAVKEPPIEGRANLAIVKALARYLAIAPSRFKIVSGGHSKKKIIDIN